MGSQRVKHDFMTEHAHPPAARRSVFWSGRLKAPYSSIRPSVRSSVRPSVHPSIPGPILSHSVPFPPLLPHFTHSLTLPFHPLFIVFPHYPKHFPRHLFLSSWPRTRAALHESSQAGASLSPLAIVRPGCTIT